MLFLETTAGPLTVLPTHRVVRGLGGDGVETLWAGLGELFEVEPVERRGRPRGGRSSRPRERPAEPVGSACGPVAGARSSTPDARRFEPWLPPGGAALRGLDVTLLQVALERLAGIDPAATAAGGRVAYTKSAAEAIAWVDRRGWTEPTPRSSSSRPRSPTVAAVAAAGDVMPQKSTYFWPKPVTGLVINPLEW